MNEKDIQNDKLIELIIESEKLEEMANISKTDYNTPVGFWVDELGNKRKIKHNDPRVKIVNNYDEDFTNLLSISISEQPEILSDTKINIKKKDLNIMKQFISHNYEILLKRWNNEITTKEMFKLLDANN